MSTEATRDGKPDPADAAGLDAAVAGVDITVTAVAEPTATAPQRTPAITGGDVAPCEAPEPGEVPRAGEAVESGEEDPEDDACDELPADEDDEASELPQARPQARRWPRTLLALGFVVVAAAIIGGAIAIVGSLTHGFKKPVKTVYRTSALFSLKTGNCFDLRGQQSYLLIPCDSPHQAEVFATFTLAGAQWPGDTAVQAKASSGCTSRLTGYVNPQLAISLSSTYVYPDSVAWQAGTRTVICEVRATSGQLTGSVRGASTTARLATTGRARGARAGLRVVDDAVRARAHQRA